MADGWASYGSDPWQASAAVQAGADGTTLVRPRPQVAVLEAHAVGTQLVAQLPAAPAGAVRWVTRITVSTPGGTAMVRAYVYVGETIPEALVMGTRAGTLDIALENPPLFIPEATPLSIQWDAGPSRALARIEYTEE